MSRIMFIIVALILLTGFMSDLSAIEIYTIKKDRVDQKLDGNRGYLMGTPPPVKGPRNTKRTIIAVDIELPAAKKPAKNKKTPADVPAGTEKETVIASANAAPGSGNVRKETVTDEDWIK